MSDYSDVASSKFTTSYDFLSYYLICAVNALALIDSFSANFNYAETAELIRRVVSRVFAPADHVMVLVNVRHENIDCPG